MTGPILVPRDVELQVMARVESGDYRNPDLVLTLAVGLLEWAETDPVGQAQLRRLATGVSDAETGPPAELLAKAPPRVESRTRRRRRR